MNGVLLGRPVSTDKGLQNERQEQSLPIFQTHPGDVHCVLFSWAFLVVSMAFHGVAIGFHGI